MCNLNREQKDLLHKVTDVSNHVLAAGLLCRIRFRILEIHLGEIFCWPSAWILCKTGKHLKSLQCYEIRPRLNIGSCSF